MKIVLLQDVPKVGKKYEVKEVADGFARNVLLKQNKAVIATPEALKKVEALQKEKAASDLHNIRVFQELAESLKQVVLVIQAKVGKEGHLFAGLHSKDVAEYLVKQTGIKVDPKFILLDKPLKTVGETTVKITNGESGTRHLEASLNISITPLVQR